MRRLASGLMASRTPLREPGSIFPFQALLQMPGPFQRPKEFEMKHPVSTLTIVAMPILAGAAYAQPAPTDKAEARAERKAQGSAAARTFMPGEGDPKPAPRAKVSKADRSVARQARKPE